MADFYRGMCIGGPLAGQQLVCEAPYYKHAEMGEISTKAPELSDDSPAFTDDDIHLYKHCEHFLHLSKDDVRSAWLHESIDDGAEGLIEVLRFYSVYRGGVKR